MKKHRITLIEGHRQLTPAASIPVLEVDPYSEETLHNSAAFFTALRQAGPVACIPKYSVLAVGR